MRSPWLAFIESNTSGTGRLFARIAAREGFRPVLLAEDAARYRYAYEDGLTVIRVNTQDVQDTLAACRSLASDGGLAGVTSSSEYFIEMAGKVARRLNLFGPRPEAVRACRDKLSQRICLQRAGIGVPRFIPADSPDAAIEAAEALGLPVVLKPVSGSGSVGVKMCERLDEVRAHAAALLRQSVNERGLPVPRRILVEEMALGPEYSVESFGRIVVGVTQKHLGPLPDFVEVGHDFPALLSHGIESAVEQTTIRALDALGLAWGPSHCELRLTDQGPKIIEVNPRLAGGYIPELVRLACGIDMLAETIKLVVGRQPELRRTMNRHTSIRFIIPDEDGVLVRADGLDEAEQSDGIVEARLYSPIGTPLRRYSDFRARVGHVIAAADSAESSRAMAEKARGKISLVIEPEFNEITSQAAQ
ncbi:MAG TPA: ATP-grasp domain-containing protein [Blastocatellia bacterium]